MSCKATANAMTVNSNNVNNSEIVRESESEIVNSNNVSNSELAMESESEIVWEREEQLYN